MRLYDKQFNESDPNWWKSIRDGMITMNKKEYEDSYDLKQHNGKVVKYE